MWEIENDTQQLSFITKDLKMLIILIDLTFFKFSNCWRKSCTSTRQKLVTATHAIIMTNAVGLHIKTPLTVAALTRNCVLKCCADVSAGEFMVLGAVSIPFSVSVIGRRWKCDEDWLAIFKSDLGEKYFKVEYTVAVYWWSKRRLFSLDEQKCYELLVSLKVFYIILDEVWFTHPSLHPHFYNSYQFGHSHQHHLANSNTLQYL